MARPIRGLSSNTIQRGSNLPSTPAPGGVKSSLLNSTRLGIQYDPTKQQQLNVSPERFQSQRSLGSSSLRDRAGGTRQWGKSMHDTVLNNIQKRKDLEQATKLQNQVNSMIPQEAPVAAGGGGNTASSLQKSVGITPGGGTRGTTAFRSEIIDRARKYLGTPYTLGGGHQRNAKTPSRGYNGIYGLDCSGLTGIVYRQMGINLPGIANQQSVFGKRTNIKNARPGDLVGWSKGGHIAIYIGGGRILHAPRPGEVVQIRNLFRGERVFAVQLTLPGD